MGLQPDRWIRQMARERGLITPFEDKQRRDGVISYGLSAYGYDIRLSDTFKIPQPDEVHGGIDPKHFDQALWQDYRGDVINVPPHSYILAHSLEHLRIPDDVLALVQGKSTYARCGIVVNVTPLEPGWHGVITMSISNTAPFPVKLYAGEGIAQVLFFRGDAPCEISYRDKQGKYQGTTGIALPTL